MITLIIVFTLLTGVFVKLILHEFERTSPHRFSLDDSVSQIKCGRDHEVLNDSILVFRCYVLSYHSLQLSFRRDSNVSPLNVFCLARLNILELGYVEDIVLWLVFSRPIRLHFEFVE